MLKQVLEGSFNLSYHVKQTLSNKQTSNSHTNKSVAILQYKYTNRVSFGLLTASPDKVESKLRKMTLIFMSSGVIFHPLSINDTIFHSLSIQSLSIGSKG